MMFPRSDGARSIDRRWHEKRQAARENSFSLAEWSDEEISRWDLDTARIDGSDNPRTFTIDRPIDTLGANGSDIRDLNDR